MPTESKEKGTTRYVSFGIDGEHMTRLLRNLWVEGRIQPAINIIDSCGCPENFWLNVFTGKAKMIGNSKDNTLRICKDSATYWNSEPLSFESRDTRFITQFIKHSIKYANADARMKYWPLRMDIIGVAYKTGKRGDYEQTRHQTFEKDKKIVENSGRELAELKPFFTYIYPLMGKSLYDIPWHSVEEELDTEFLDYYHPNYLPVMNDRVKNGKKVQTVNGKDELEKTTLGKYPMPKSGEISDTIRYQNKPTDEEVEQIKHEPITPFGIDIPNITNAWIDRNGNFYGDRRSSIMFTLIHIELAEKMQEDGIIPTYKNMPIWKNGKPEPSRYLEGTGWIKLSANQFLYYPENIRLKVTQSQINTIKKYAKIRNLKGVNIGYFDKNLPIDELTIKTFER